jgi:tetratricopeptide (TPR) repeat protein
MRPSKVARPRRISFMNVHRRPNPHRPGTGALTRSAVLALAFVTALAGALVVGSAKADDTHDHSHEGHDHSHDTPAPASPVPAAAAPAKAPAKNAKAGPDSLTKIMAEAKKDSTNAKKQYRLGVALLDRDQAAEAVLAFEKAVKAKPDFIEAWVNLGAARDATGHGPEARQAYRSALAIRDSDEIALCRLASSYYATGQRDSAMAVLRQTIAKNPKSHCSYFTLGVSFADAGMFKEAIKSWEKVVDFAPTSPEAESAKESIKLLREYMGADSAKVATPVPANGVPAGAGGPGTPLPGGEMNSTGMKGAPKAADSKSGDAKSASKTDSKSGGK